MVFYYFLLMQTFYATALIGTRPIITLYAYHSGASEAFIGLIVALFALLPMIFSVQVGRWMDQFGAWKMSIFGGFGMFLSALLTALFPNLGLLLVTQMTMGLAHTCVLVALQKTVGNLKGSRDKLIATFSLAGSMGEFLGPSINGYAYEHYGFSVSFGISGIFILLAVTIGLVIGKSAWKTGEKSHDVQVTQLQSTGSTWTLMKNADLRNALIISGLVIYSKDLFTAYFPVYGSQLGMSAGQIGLFLSLMAAMSVLIRVMQFYLIKKFERSIILFVSLVVSGLVYISIPFISWPIVLACLAMTLGAGLGLGQPLSLVYAMNSSPMGRQGEVLGMRIGVNRTSQFAAPIIFGAIGTVAGLSLIFWLGGSILLWGAIATTRPSKKTSNQ